MTYYNTYCANRNAKTIRSYRKVIFFALVFFILLERENNINSRAPFDFLASLRIRFEGTNVYLEILWSERKEGVSFLPLGISFTLRLRDRMALPRMGDSLSSKAHFSVTLYKKNEQIVSPFLDAFVQVNLFSSSRHLTHRN